MLVHWIWLAHRPGLNDRIKYSLLQHFSDPEDVYFAAPESYARVEGLTAEAAKQLADKDLSESEKILADAMKQKLHILTCRDASYPGRLLHIPDPPLVLYYKGSLLDFDALPLIGVVGTRKATPYGLTMAKRLGQEIAQCGGIVVSGMAGGIDSMAMKSALSAGAPVVGILGCGADRVYPPSNRSLFADTERYGCILSEFPPGTEPYRWNFPRRNRIISGMSCGVLVVEAPEKSGSLITAHHALEQGRDVFVVPGNLDQPTFVGNNRLLRDGGILVSSGWDILSEYKDRFPGKVRQSGVRSRQTAYPDEIRDVLPETVGKPGKVAQSTALPRNKSPKKAKSNKIDVDKSTSENYSDVNKDLSALTDEQQTIVRLLRDGERLVDQLIAEAGLPAGKVSTAITMLAIRGIVKKLPGNRVSLK